MQKRRNFFGSLKKLHQHRVKFSFWLNSWNVLTFLFFDVNDGHKSGNLECPVDVVGANPVHGRVDDSPFEAGVPIEIIHQA